MIYSEEKLPIPVGLGMDIYTHPANLPDGFCQNIENFIAKEDRLVTRKGFSKPSQIDLGAITHRHPNALYYTQFPNVSNHNLPVALWGHTDSGMQALRQFNRSDPAQVTTGDGEATFTALERFRGGCTYLDRVYLNVNGGIIRVTGWNWTNGTVTSTTLSNTPTNTHGLFAFKDRLWTWDNTKIYYTNVPSGPGQYPETWNVTGNFAVIGSSSGMGTIFQIIPSGTKLYVFTSTGLYNISIIGSPENWVVRTMDTSVSVNTYSCAYEFRGLIYFVDINGVWVTNGADVHKISQSIEPIFNVDPLDIENGIYYYYKLVPFDDGIVVCRVKTFVNSELNYVETPADIFYTPLDFVAWTKFTFNNTAKVGDIGAGFARIETYEFRNPRNYLLLATGNSVIGSPSALSSLIYQYGEYRDRFPSSDDAPVQGKWKSKVIRGEFIQEKKSKYAYLNLSNRGSDTSNMNISYSWDSESEDDIRSGVVTDENVDPKESLVMIEADFKFRHVELEVTATLASGIREYSFMGGALVLHTERNEGRRAS